MTKIKVFYVGEFSVKFDMADESDLLPEEGEYHLVKVGSESSFILEFIKELQHSNINLEQKLKLLLAKMERKENESEKI